MTVKDIMTSQFELIEATCSLNEAAQKMEALNVGVLPICEGTKLIGVITDRDIVVRGLAQQRDPSSTQVKEIISSHLICCSQDDSIEEAVRLMEESQVRRLIVCDQEGTSTGIVSLGDIATKARQEELAGAALESISEPATPRR